MGQKGLAKAFISIISDLTVAKVRITNQCNPFILTHLWDFGFEETSPETVRVYTTIYVVNTQVYLARIQYIPDRCSPITCRFVCEFSYQGH